MTLNDVLLALLEPMGSTGESHLITWDFVQQWPIDALDRILKTGILTPAKTARSVECQGCEKRCFMEVYRQPGADNRPTRAFVVCDDPEMQTQMGCVEIPIERLQQWKATVFQLAKVVAELLNIESKAEDRHGYTNIRIGMMKGKNGRRWLSLNKSPLTLAVTDHQMPLEEVLFFEGDALTLDQDQINQLIDKTPRSSGKKYTPSTEKRDAGKRKTEAMYEDWRDAYRKLRRKYPDIVSHTDTWISLQIAKKDIAKDRGSETIRKEMKK